MKTVCCLDLEGILVPEIWIHVAKKTQIDALKLTTRDISDYDKLMRYRLRILKQKGIKLQHIQKIIRGMKPLAGARAFLRRLQARMPVMILSDTYYEFAGPLLDQLGNPVLFCNWLKVNHSGTITGYVLRQKDGKRKAVNALKQMGFYVKAAGDSYNDVTMLKEAHAGVLFNPPPNIRKSFKQFPVARNYKRLLRLLSG